MRTRAQRTLLKPRCKAAISMALNTNSAHNSRQQDIKQVMWSFRAGKLSAPNQGLPPLPFPFCTSVTRHGPDKSIAPVKQARNQKQSEHIGPLLGHQSRAASTVGSWKTCKGPPSEQFSYPTTAVTTRAKSISGSESAWLKRLEQLEAAVSCYLVESGLAV
jgi:hypothetical protein